ncbi:hypothetical protein LTR65_001668 [Meristemomyces frigidus]
MTALAGEEPSFPTHGLLLGFKNSHLTEDIEELAHAMRETLGWKTSVYWIDGQDTEDAGSRLSNIGRSLRSKIKHPEERVVVYYGGHGSQVFTEAAMREWGCCGTLWHRTPRKDTVECLKCGISVDPSWLLREILRLPNDVLFLFHSYFDTGPSFQAWAREKEQLFRPDYRQRLIQMIVLPEPATSEFHTTTNTCSDKSCRTILARQIHPASQASATAKLRETLLGVELGHRFKIGSLLTGLRGIAKLEVDMLPITPNANELDLTKGPRPSTHFSKPPYAAAHALLVGWGISPKPHALDTMAEAFGYLNYTTESMQIPCSDGWIGHEGWLGQRVEHCVKEHGKAGSLLVVYYSGQGGDGGHLKGAPFRSYGPEVDLTRLQTQLREDCEADVLLVLDCCNAGFVPQPIETSHLAGPSPADHIMETLAACPSKSLTISNGRHTFANRFAGQLILHAGEKGMTVDQYNTLLACDWRYRDDRGVSADPNTMRGNVRFLTCGRGSIVLERLPSKTERETEEEVD